MKPVLLVLSALLFGHLPLLAQLQKNDTCGFYYNKLYQSVQETYGIDQVLVNGIFYEDRYPGQIGHPFLFENRLYDGTITFRGEKYDEIDLKYDLYEQQIILYTNQNNSVSWFIPPNDFISEFSLEGKNFIKLRHQGESRFYQVIFNSDKLKCLYYRSKSKFNSDVSRTYSKAEFKDNPRRNYLLWEGEFIKYRNNRSFVKAFPKEIKPLIRNYLFKNKIKVVRANDDQVFELFVYCGSVLKY